MNKQFNNEDRPAQREQLATVAVKLDNILEFISANPNVAAQSRDDAQCRSLFAELGMLDLFPAADTPSLAVLEFPGHPTHWIIGMQWSGYSEPGGNGYNVFCLPKKHVPAEGMKDVVRYIQEKYGGNDLEVDEVYL